MKHLPSKTDDVVLVESPIAFDHTKFRLTTQKIKEDNAFVLYVIDDDVMEVGSSVVVVVYTTPT